MGRAVKNSLEIINKQVRLEGGNNNNNNNNNNARRSTNRKAEQTDTDTTQTGRKLALIVEMPVQQATGTAIVTVGVGQDNLDA